MSLEEASESGSEEQDESDLFEPTFAMDILQLHHSFGYDCQRLFNLTLIDADTLVFASGNLIHYFSISQHLVTFRETVFGAGIGFITKNTHPDYENLLTVAENGLTPTIFIYEFPSHNVRIQLSGAAKSTFTCGSYNATGELFASQAGYPDYMLTIWRWEKAEVVLRSKSFQNDVLNVHFSNFNPILLVSCGLSHIKFWKMANTFTGLKLKGDLGRFGKTDFSDIYAIYMLPDENVISGCEWGNILLWEAGLIKFEVCRKGRKPCHARPITRITMDNSEVTTVGMDGYVRIWFWETVDLADPPDEDRFVEIEPIYEFKIGDCEIRGLQKIKPFEEKDFSYYAQDGKGGIWYCELNTIDIPQTPRKLYACHGGKVIAIQASPVHSHMITLGEDGKIFAYDYEAKKLLLEKEFTAVGTDLLWFNTKISNNGCELVASFEDGMIRQLLFEANDLNKKAKMHLVRIIKAHTAAVTKLTVNPLNTILVTGAADRTVFIYKFGEQVGGLVNLEPLGFIEFQAIPNSFNWQEGKSSQILIGSKSGEVYEYDLPVKTLPEDTFLSYRLTNETSQQSTKFVSVKSRIRREIRREEIKKRKALKRQQKIKDVEKLKAANPGLQIDMESALADSEPEEEEEPLHIPPKPNPILWLKYTERETIWVSMGGYDAGYIYELQFGAAEPVQSTLFFNGDDCEIHSYLKIDEYLIFGLVSGQLRINRIFPDDFTNMRDYHIFNMHDALKGNIPQIVPSHDGKYIFSVGHDGNIFSYHWRGPVVKMNDEALKIAQTPSVIELVHDIDDPAYPSLEQEKINDEIKRQQEAASEHDRQVLAKIAELQVQFNELMRMNRTLPKEIQIRHRDMLLDDRIIQQIGNELQAELDDVRKDLAYDLEVAQVGKTKLFDHFLKELDHVPIKLRAIGTDFKLHSFRVKKLGEDFKQKRAEIEERLRLEAAQPGEERKESLKPEPTEFTLAEEKEASMPDPPTEFFFFGRDPSAMIPRFSKKMLRLLRNYRGRQLYEIERMYNWDKLERLKPDPNKNHPTDEQNIQEAQRSLGDYKLKIGADYEPGPHEDLTQKYIDIANGRENHFNLLNNFNQKLFHLREEKKQLYDFIADQRRRLAVIHKLIPAKNHLHLPVIPDISMDDEYPELNLVEHCKPGCGIEIKDVLFGENTVKDLRPQPAKKKQPEVVSIEEMEEYNVYKSLRAEELVCVPLNDDLMKILNKLPKKTDPTYYASEGNEPSPWLIESRFHWLLNLLDEQEGIIYSVTNRTKQFDAALNELAYERLNVELDSEFMQCYMISLNQELHILRDSEEIEKQMLHKADETMKTRNQMQVMINAAKRTIDECRKTVDRLNEQINVIQLKFLSAAKGHKFYDFLRRIFKKRWRLPKPTKDNEESSESSSDEESSSEDEQDDAKSVDSTDITTIRLDETHCPLGLERTMYDLAFKMRSERHDLEKALMEQNKLIELRLIDVKDLQKSMKFHEEVYAQEKATLLTFRRKRQQELNKVQVAVILQMNQLQHFYPDDDYRDLSKAILFDAGRLTDLKTRVDQLKIETVETKRVHRVNIVHLRRMNTDIVFMRREIKHLEDCIREEMMKKFGMVVDLDDLQEEVLRKYVFELETTAEEELRQIDQDIKRKKLELASYQEELIRETQTNTEKLNVLSVLQEEKNFLDEILALQEKNYEKWLKPNKIDFDRDIEKLLAIERHQKEQIQCLEREICTLRLKAKPLQMDQDSLDKTAVVELTPSDEVTTMTCRAALLDAYQLRMQPDDFIMERVQKLVQKCFGQCFAQHMSKDNIRKYSHKVARYLGQAAYSLEGKVTDRILDCITENLPTLLPKKYLIHLSGDELCRLFNEIISVFDYERSDVNTEDVISGIFDNALESMRKQGEILNRTQHIVVNMFKQLIEVFSLEEFASESTQRIIVEILIKEHFVDPKCISVENLVEAILKHAEDNLLDGITGVPIRRLANGVHQELLQRRHNDLTARCSIGSVASVSIKKK